MLALPVRRSTGDEARESWGEALKGVGHALQVRSFWNVFALHATTYSAFACIVGLWAGPWLADIHGAGLQERGNLILLAAAAQITGIFAWGASDRWFRSYRRAALTGGSLGVGLLLAAALLPLEGAGLALWPRSVRARLRLCADRDVARQGAVSGAPDRARHHLE